MYEKYIGKLNNATSLCDFIGMVLNTSIQNVEKILGILELMINKVGNSTNRQMQNLLKEAVNYQSLYRDYILSQSFKGWAIGHNITFCHEVYKPVFNYNMSLCGINYPLLIHNHNLYFESPLCVLEQYYLKAETINDADVFKAVNNNLYLIGTKTGDYDYSIVDWTDTHMKIEIYIPDSVSYSVFCFNQGEYGLGIVYASDLHVEINEDEEKCKRIISICWEKIDVNQNIHKEYFNELFKSGTSDVVEGYCLPEMNLDEYMPFDVLIKTETNMYDVVEIINKYIMKIEQKSTLENNKTFQIECISFLPNDLVKDSLGSLATFYKKINEYFWNYYIQNESEKNKAEHWISCTQNQMELIKEILRNDKNISRFSVVHN